MNCRLHIVSFSIMSASIILAFIMVTSITSTGFGSIGIAHGQTSPTAITPEEKAVMCNPSNPKLKVINMTESKICGIPVTIKASPGSSANSATTSKIATTTPSEINNTSQSIISTFIP